MRVRPPTSGCAWPFSCLGKRASWWLSQARGRFGPFGAPRAPFRPRNNLRGSKMPQVTLGEHRHPRRFRHSLRLTGSLVPVVLLKMGREGVVPLPWRRPALLRSNRAHLLLHQRQMTSKE
ncbi:hypothetical protein HPB47_006127 [Ixodes persulcatus]|uniref:Uncharacterized protein n=1 Tax=Ixodes persulcatus TaxID=34615 RepID=A0AC60PC96_IXOPE|nr:hypothetical protein HPB47_006127 [Ixodes persulcatus]